DSTNAGEICSVSENVGEIHRQRIRRALAELERGHRRSWRDNRVHFFKGFHEILANQFPDFLGADVVSVVVTGAQNICAEYDSAFYFRAESFLAGATVMIE